MQHLPHTAKIQAGPQAHPGDEQQRQKRSRIIPLHREAAPAAGGGQRPGKQQDRRRRAAHKQRGSGAHPALDRDHMVAEILGNEAAGREARHGDAGFPAVLRVGEKEDGFVRETAYAGCVHAQRGVIHIFQQGGFKELPVHGVEVYGSPGGDQHQQEGSEKAAEKRSAAGPRGGAWVMRHALSSHDHCIFR